MTSSPIFQISLQHQTLWVKSSRNSGNFFMQQWALLGKAKDTETTGAVIQRLGPTHATARTAATSPAT